MSRPDFIGKRVLGEIRPTEAEEPHALFEGMCVDIPYEEDDNASAQILCNQGEFPGELRF